MAKTVFWVSFVCIVYVYIGYPFLLTLWRLVGRRPVKKQYREPAVSIVIAMHNEEEYAREKIRNCFELDYPPDKLQVIVSLDAPTDGTDDLLQAYTAEGVQLVYCPVRKGKADALNRGVAAATGEIVLFGDARQRLERQALRELVANFSDETVGAVSGELMLLDSNSKEASDGVGLYWRYEKKLRAMESDIHSVPGATGAIYAIRRRLFRPLPQGAILDDVAIPMSIVLGGKRAIFEPAARAYGVSDSPDAEFVRKRRTLAGNYQLLVEMPRLLSPWRNPIFLQLVSHKVGRLVVPYCLAALFVSNVFVLESMYGIMLSLQVMWYTMACLASRWSHCGKVLSIPYTFVLLNWAPVAGLYHFLRGRSLGVWNPVAIKNT